MYTLLHAHHQNCFPPITMDVTPLTPSALPLSSFPCGNRHSVVCVYVFDFVLFC